MNKEIYTCKPVNNKKRLLIIIGSVVLLLAAILLAVLLLKDKTYNVYYETNGGDYIETVEVKENSELGKQPEPVKDGFDFLGWFYDVDLSKPINEKDIVIEDLYLYASYKEKNTKFKVEFETNGDEEINYSFTLDNGLLGPLPQLIRDGYVFKGWYYDQEFTREAVEGDRVERDVQLYAKFVEGLEITYIIEGEQLDNKIVLKGEKVGELLEPEIYGCVFDGWYYEDTFITPVAEDDIVNNSLTIYAKFIIKVSVTFKSNGAQDIPSREGISGYILTALPEVSKENYKFEGWYYEYDYVTLALDGDVLTESVVLYAKFTEYVNISYVTLGDDIPNKKVLKGSLIGTLPETSKEGLIFGGWYYDNDYTKPVRESDEVLESIVLYAFLKDTLQVNYIVGGEVIETNKIQEGDLITSQPIPYSLGYTFDGWYTDAICTIPFDKGERVLTNLDLYAKYVENEIPEKESISYECLENINPDYTFIVFSKSNLEITTFKEIVELNNLSRGEIEDFNISKDPVSDGYEYSIKGLNGEFNEGSTYRLKLNDKRLSFKDLAQEVREYNFNIVKDEVLNLQMSRDIKYVLASSISSIIENELSTDSISGGLVKLSSTGELESELSEGTFTYSGELEVGDKVCVYSGVRPDLRTLETPEEQCGAISYIVITSKDGTTYGYKQAEAKDIIFKPDILPIPSIADIDGDPFNNSITIEKYYVDYSLDIYSNINLSSETTVDIGDYIVFYTGEFSKYLVISSYAEIESVSILVDTIIISFEDCTWDDISHCMDIYTKEGISGEELLEGVNQEELQELICEAAAESGFVNMACDYLTSVALLSENLITEEEAKRYRDYKYASSDFTVSVSSSFNAKVTTKLVHFSGYSGFRVAFTITSKITFTEKSTGERSVIDIVGEFEQEVRLSFDVDCETVWKVYGIFPYIADYKISISVDLYDYTGIDINATMLRQYKTEDGSYASNNEYINISDRMNEYLNSQSDEDGATLSEELSLKYKSLVQEETQWVTIINKELTKKEFKVPKCLPIVVCEIEINFIVKVDASVCAGFGFHYENAKRYVYTISAFKGKVNNDVINIRKEKYDVSFSFLGRLRVKAGIEAIFKVGLISTKLDNIGFIAESGAYIYSYGYFYYDLVNNGSKKVTTKDGALYFEIGVYLDVDFVAEVLGGKYSTTKSIYYKEFLLYTAGDKESILDFNTTEEDLPEVFLKQYIRNSCLPDSLFAMKVQDLLSGTIYAKQYSDKDDFLIEMTNPSFVYNPSTNLITVIPSDGVTTLEGDMIITFKNRSLSFTSSPLQRVIHLYWDNLRDGYVILPFTNGGSYIPIITAAAGGEITLPSDPFKEGYEFAGWFIDPSFMTPYIFPEVMGEEDTTIYAKWTESTDTKYTVEHYLEKLGSSEYDLWEITSETGTTNSLVTPLINTYEGYTSPKEGVLIISADGTSVHRYYYNRVTCSITFDYGVVAEESEEYTLKYGADICAPVLFFEGYVFTGWDKTVASAMGTTDLLYVAQWEYITPLTSYKVEYYVQNEEGRLFLDHEAIILDVEIDSFIDTNTLHINTYVIEGLVYHGSDTIDGIAVIEFKPKVDGSTVIKINYLRYIYKVTYVLDNDYPNIEYSFYSGKQTIPKIPNPTKVGYTFIGWDKEAPEELLEDLVITAIWEEIEYQEYRILRYFASATDRFDFSLYYEDIVTNTNDLYSNILTKTYTGLHLDIEVTGDYIENAITEEDTKIISLYYSRNVHKYSIYYENNEPVLGYQDIEFVYGDSIEVLPESEDLDRIIYRYSLDGDNFYGVLPDKDCIIIQHTRPKQEEYGEFAGIVYCSVICYNYSYNEYGDQIKATQYIIGEKDTSMLYKGLYDATPGYDLSGDGETIYFAPLEEGGTHDISLFYYPSYYNITFNYNGGFLMGPDPLGQGCQCGMNDFNAPLLEKEGYILSWDKPIPHFLPFVDVYDRTLVFNAVWKLGDNAAVFKDINGNEITRISGEPDIEVTAPTPPDRLGYTFSGNWSPYNPEVIGGGITNYYPIYDLINYDIEYIYNTTDTVINNPNNKDYFTVQNGTIGLYNPQRSGYTFIGWYDNRELSGESKTLVTIDPLNPHPYTFYAKWQVNPYVIIFDNGLLSELAQEDTQLFIYDEPQDLDLNPFTNTGYTFKGWAESPNGEVLYEDGENVSRVTATNEIRLYAYWEPINYSITYNNIDIVSSLDNPITYTIEDDIIFTKPISVDESYMFLGWYDENDNEVKGFSKGHHDNIILTAKWAHGGIFNIELVSIGSTATFKVTRTIPEGTIVTTDPQQVYYRTQNGTAVGGTARAINFMHVGGPEVLLTFYQDDMEKTFDVINIRTDTEYCVDGYNHYPQVGYTTLGFSKYFTVEIYKVLSTIGNCTGVLGNQTSQKVDISNLFEYQIDYSYYNDYQMAEIDYQMLTSRLWNIKKYFIFNPLETFSNYNNYYSYTADGYYWFMTLSIECSSYTTCVINFYNYDEFQTIRMFVYDDFDRKIWNDVRIPLPQGEKTGTSTETTKQINVDYMNNAFKYNNQEKAFDFPINMDKMKMEFTNRFSFELSWYISNIREYAKLYDDSAPKQIGLAPLSFGSYNKGDKIQIAVVYDEIIHSATDISIADTQIGDLSLKDFQFIGGLETCVLVFEATVDSDNFLVDPDFNYTVINTKLKVNGDIKDSFGN